jgi:hypothetical protein
MRAYVTWFTPPPTCDRVFPGVVMEKNEHAGSWSLVLHRTDEDDDVFEATWLVPDKAPPLTVGKAFMVYQGKTRTCHVEVTFDDDYMDECRRLLDGDYHANPTDGPVEWRDVAIGWVHQTYNLDPDDAARLVDIEVALMGKKGK